MANPTRFPLISSLATAMSLAALVASCSAPTVLNDVASQDAASTDVADLKAKNAGNPLQVVTTFLPMTYFTEAVAGDRAIVTQLLPPGVDPHDYQAKPQDIQRLAAADALIENGLGLEAFLEPLIANANNPDLAIVDSSKGIEVLGEEDGHDHDHEGPDHEGHDHGAYDPHLWLDPKKAIQQVENIRDGLITVDPEGKAVYTTNADDYIADIRALDVEISETLLAYAGQSFVTYHDFAAHFAHSYDLEVEHLVGIPESNAAPADVQRVIETVRASNLKTLLSEPRQDEAAFGAIATDLDISVSVFDPMESSRSANPQPDDYLTTMTANLENLAAAFKAAQP